MDMPDVMVPLQAGCFYLCPVTTCPRGNHHPFLSKDKAIRHIRGEHTLEQVWTAWVDRDVQLPASWNEWLELHT